MSEMPAERCEALDMLLIVDPDSSRAVGLASALGSVSRDVRVANDLRAALEQVAETQPDLVLVETALLAMGGAVLLERIATLAPWATLIALAGPVEAAARRALLRRYELHAIHDGDPSTLDDVVESALAAARRSRRRLAESELREVIVAKLCHEMRTCLYVIEGYAEILCDAGDAQGREEAATRIGSTSQLALGLLQDYLDLARLEPRAGEAQVTRVDVALLFDELRDDLRRRSGVRPLRLDVVGVAAGDALAVDADQLRAVLCHLVTTVAERSGQAAVRVAVRAGVAATEFVVTSAADCAAETSWQRSRAATVARDDVALSGIRGQGLALAIAFRLSRMLGATLYTDHGAAAGARHSLHVPRRPVTVNERTAQESTAVLPILH